MHEKHNQLFYGLSVVRVLETHVQQFADKEWNTDTCKPEFIVSLSNEDMDSQVILITIDHNSIKFTEKLFPRKGTEYGYDSLENQMINMYNQTM
jgi:hypothetical protein